MVIASRVGAGEVWSGVGTLGSPLVGERSLAGATQGSPPLRDWMRLKTLHTGIHDNNTVAKTRYYPNITHA